MFLLDTDVISELRKPLQRRNRNVVRWLGQVPSEAVFVSVLAIVEIERGIERARKSNPVLAENLTAWLDLVLRAYDNRILPVTVDIGRRWGRLSQQIGNKSVDLAIAATALEHGLTVATRNVSDFGLTGVAVINPFDPAPTERG